VLNEYFKEGSSYLNIDKQFGIERKTQRNNEYASLFRRILIPYLNERHIFTFNDLTVGELNKFQEYCINQHVSNKNITEIFYALKIVYNRLVVNGVVEHNIIKDVVLVKRQKSKEKGIFNAHDIKGVFQEAWEHNEDEYVINLIAAVTGMRNSEIRLLKVDNFETINGVHFINVMGTKNEYAIRKVAVGDFVYNKIQDYIKKHDRTDYLFLRNNERVYTKVEISRMFEIFALRLGFSKSYLKEHNITFHSHRHLFSTVLYESGEVSSDWIEYFLGHRQQGVKAVYIHLRNVSGKCVCEKVLQIISDTIL
jgi:integrase